jgi:hypothetical protein
MYLRTTRVFQLVRTFSYLNIYLEILPSKPGNQESKIMQHIKKAAAFSSPSNLTSHFFTQK